MTYYTKAFRFSRGSFGRTSQHRTGWQNNYSSRRQKMADIHIYQSLGSSQLHESWNPFVQITILLSIGPDWFKNYLANRTRYVDLDPNASSPRKYITTGVPKESILGFYVILTTSQMPAKFVNLHYSQMIPIYLVQLDTRHLLTEQM